MNKEQVKIGKSVLLACLARCEAEEIQAKVNPKDPNRRIKATLRVAPFNLKVINGIPIAVVGGFGYGVYLADGVLVNEQVLVNSKQATPKVAKAFIKSLTPAQVEFIGQQAQSKAEPAKVAFAVSKWSKKPLLVKSNKKI